MIDEALPWLALLVVLGLALFIPAAVLRANEKRQERKREKAREWRALQTPRTRPLDRQFLESTAEWKHNHGPKDAA